MIKITHHIAFDFKNRRASDIEKLNKILASMKLEDLELEDFEGYLAVTRDGEGNLLGKRYGLDRGVMICTSSKDGRYYQIDTVVTDRSVDHDEFLEIWRLSHSNRELHTVFTIECNTDLAYLILHYQKA